MKPRGSIVGPLILIALGVLFLFHNILPNFSALDLLARFWPFLLIALGLLRLIEISIRAARGWSLPVNGISGGAWFLIVLFCFFGWGLFTVRTPNNWWKRIGIEHSVEVFGNSYNYTFTEQHATVGKTPRVVIEGFRGDAKITGSDDPQIRINGQKTIRALEQREADQADADTPVELTVQGDTVTVRCNQDRVNPRTRISTELDLMVPKSANIQITGRQGDLEVNQINGPVEIISDNAGVGLEDIGGNVKIDTRRSDSIRCTNVKGTVDLRGRGNDLDLQNIAGQVTINGSYGGVITLRELAKPLRFEGAQTEFRVEGLPGQIRLERGSFSAENFVGPLQLFTRATDIQISNFSEPIEITADKGDIDLRPSKLPLGKMTVKTHAGKIDLAIPTAAKFDLRASTNRGEIENEFGDPLKVESDGRGAKLQGIVGVGPVLNLATNRGTITVRRTSADEILPPSMPKHPSEKEPSEPPEPPKAPARVEL